MVWNLSPKQHRVYPRNPLVAVVADLRYHPNPEDPTQDEGGRITLTLFGVATTRHRSHECTSGDENQATR